MPFVDVMTSDVLPLLYYRRILFDLKVDFLGHCCFIITLRICFC